MAKLDALWNYQQAELERDALEHRLKSTPSRVKLNKLYAFLTEQQNQVASIQKQFDSRKAMVDKLNAAFEEIENKYELELSEYQIMEQDEEVTAAEMTEARKSVEGLLKQLDNARRELFDLMNWIEKATAEYKETYTKAGKAKKEYDEIRKLCEEEIAAAQPEITAANAKLDMLASGIDPKLMEKYKKVKTHHANPVAIVENNQCGGCNMALPTVVVKKVAATQSVVECETCGRMLYMPGQ